MNEIFQNLFITCMYLRFFTSPISNTTHHITFDSSFRFKSYDKNAKDVLKCNEKWPVNTIASLYSIFRLAFGFG